MDESLTQAAQKAVRVSPDNLMLTKHLAQALEMAGKREQADIETEIRDACHVPIPGSAPSRASWLLYANASCFE